MQALEEIDDQFWIAAITAERQAFQQSEFTSTRLTSERELSLRAYNGDDVSGATEEALRNRSRVQSLDVFEAVETIMPDLVEIFLSGDEILSFRPVSVEDEAAARQETSLVRHTVFERNQGFLAIYSAMKDALLTKTGILHWYTEETNAKQTDTYQGLTQLDAASLVLREQGLGRDVYYEDAIDGTVNLRVEYRELRKQVEVRAIPPENFYVSTSASSLQDEVYASYRTYLRIQDMVAAGYDLDKLVNIPASSYARHNRESIARDTVDETINRRASSSSVEMLRVIEVTNHYLRIDLGEGICLYRIVTGGEYSGYSVIDVEKVHGDRLPFAILTPYVVTHRIYGRSVGDLVIEIQRIKTALWRMSLDSGYFSVNGRVEIAEDRATQDTYDDVLANQPGRPVRSRTGDAVRPIPNGTLSFDPFAALEYASVAGEMRSGAMRNAQGLNPDTLHDTAAGSRTLIAAAQKRVRMIARLFAEMGLRELYLGVHAAMRIAGDREIAVQQFGSWVKGKPNDWLERNDVVCHVGSLSGTRADELAAAQQVLALQIQAIDRQGGMDGPFVKAENIYNTLRILCEKSSLRDASRFFLDPTQPGSAPAPKPPQMSDVDKKLAMQQQEAELKQQLDEQKFAFESRLAQMRLEAEIERADRKQEFDLELARARLNAELELKMQQLELGERDTVRFGGALG